MHNVSVIMTYEVEISLDNLSYFCNNRYVRRRGSVVEQLFRKQQVTGSNPVVGLNIFSLKQADASCSRLFFWFK